MMHQQNRQFFTSTAQEKLMKPSIIYPSLHNYLQSFCLFLFKPFLQWVTTNDTCCEKITLEKYKGNLNHCSILYIHLPWSPYTQILGSPELYRCRICQFLQDQAYQLMSTKNEMYEFLIFITNIVHAQQSCWIYFFYFLDNIFLLYVNEQFFFRAFTLLFIHG